MTVKTVIRRGVDSYAPWAARLYRELRDTIHAHGEGVATPWGFTIIGDRGLAQSRHVSNEANTFLRLLSDVDHVIDVGANVGLFTLIAASKGVPATAVEPNEENVKVLLENLRNNDIVAEVLPLALASETGVLELYGGGQGASLVRGWGGMRSTYSALVPVATLDNLFADRMQGSRALVKVDAEGAEHSILMGATKMLEGDHSWIVEIGLTENFNDAVNPDFMAIFDMFWSRGYTAHAIEADAPVSQAEVAQWVAAGQRPWWNINYLFTR